jgi:hypothetical protein
VERRHELVGVGLTTPDVGDGPQRGEVGVVDVEDAVPVLEGGVVASQLVAGRPRATREDVDAVLVGRGDVELALEDVHQLGPLAE